MVHRQFSMGVIVIYNSFLSFLTHDRRCLLLNFHWPSTDQYHCHSTFASDTGDALILARSAITVIFRAVVVRFLRLWLNRDYRPEIHRLPFHPSFVNNMNTRARSSSSIMRLRSQGANTNTDNDTASTTGAAANASRTALVSGDIMLYQ